MDVFGGLMLAHEALGKTKQPILIPDHKRLKLTIDVQIDDLLCACGLRPRP
jgi:hypothetical protein